jgi:hypothetical protein
VTRLKLVSDQPTELERMLLNAAARERPSLEQHMRVRRALGLPRATSIPTSSLGTGMSVGGKAVVWSLLSVGAIAALLFTRDAPLVAPSQRSAPVEAVALVPPPVGLGVGTGPAVSSPDALGAAPIASPLPDLAPPKAVSVSGRARSTSNSKLALAATPASDLREQIRLIEQARAAVGKQDPSLVLRTLDSYAGRFPKGSFGQEAAVLRMEALVQRGEQARAASLARTFIAKYPSSTHANRVERISGEH